jgi:hypothetical protein
VSVATRAPGVNVFTSDLVHKRDETFHHSFFVEIGDLLAVPVEGGI